MAETTVLITGCNRGIGLGFTRHYLAAGCRVLATCRTPDRADALQALSGDYPDRLIIEALDVNDDQMLSVLSQKYADQPIDLLICNAGVYGPRGARFGEIDRVQFLQTMETNAFAPLNMVQQFMAQLSAGSDKKCVLLTSKMGSMTDNSSGGAYIYRASKAALNAIGKSLAHDLHTHGIAVALIHPGWVRTDMGTSAALIDVETSIAGMAAQINQLSLASSGGYFDYSGAPIGW